jgi:outer membrane protein assembly factor BamB
VQGPLSANLKWSSSLFASPRSGAAVGPDGRIYIGSGRMLCALDKDNGQADWCKRIGGTVKFASPAIDASGHIYIGGRDNRLHSFNPSGTLNWEFPVGVDGDIATGPAIKANGKIYFGGSGYTFAINPNGSSDWSVQLNGPILTASPALGADGTIYVATVHGWIYAISPGGILQWSKRLEGSIRYSAPSVAADGTIYIGTSRGLTAVHPADGSIVWEFPTPGRVTNTAAIAADGTIYFGAISGVGLGTLYALSPDRDLLWTYNGGRLRASPLIGSDGTIYIGSGASVVALEPDGSAIWQFPTERGIYASLALDDDGTLYVPAGERTLYALQP